MRSNLTLCIVLGLSTALFAKGPKPHQTGKVLQMESVQCGVPAKDASTFAEEIREGDSGSKKTQELQCQEYLLQSERVIYRIRPRDEKHAVLLPVNEVAQFRLQKDKMLLRVEDFDNKEREYSVISMTPRSEDSKADATPPHLNHLQ